MSLGTRGGPANSGTKFPPREQPKTGWTCACGYENRSYAVTCMGAHCVEKRP